MTSGCPLPRAFVAPAPRCSQDSQTVADQRAAVATTKWYPEDMSTLLTAEGDQGATMDGQADGFQVNGDFEQPEGVNSQRATRGDQGETKDGQGEAEGSQGETEGGQGEGETKRGQGEGETEGGLGDTEGGLGDTEGEGKGDDGSQPTATVQIAETNSKPSPSVRADEVPLEPAAERADKEPQYDGGGGAKAAAAGSTVEDSRQPHLAPGADGAPAGPGVQRRPTRICLDAIFSKHEDPKEVKPSTASDAPHQSEGAAPQTQGKTEEQPKVNLVTEMRPSAQNTFLGLWFEFLVLVVLMGKAFGING